MKKIVWLVIALVSMIGIVTAEADMTTTISTWAVDQWVIADTDSLDTNLTRAQAAQLYLNLAKSTRTTGTIMDLMTQDTGTWCVFSDITNHPYHRTIATACQRWLMRWDNGLFQPDQPLTVLQAFVTLSRIYWWPQDESQTPWYSNYINRWLTNQLITADQINSITNNTTVTTNSILQRSYSITHPSDTSWITKIKWLFTNNTQDNFSNTWSQSTGMIVIQNTGTDSSASWKDLVWWTWDDTYNRSRLTWLVRLLLAIIVRYLIQFIWWWFTRSQWTPVPTWVTPSWIHDDLTLIEGIGPKVQQILYDHDILTYETLAKMTPWHISNILAPYGSSYEYMNPITRPRQAALARDGQREKLEDLKRELFRGT